MTSIPSELATYAELAVGVAEFLDWEILARDLGVVKSVDQGLTEMDRADLVLALVGWCKGPTPGPLEGWDGSTPWLAYELRRAFELRKPVVVLRAGEDWPEREGAARDRSWMADFRAELEPLALPLERETDAALPALRRCLEAELSQHGPRERGPTSSTLSDRIPSSSVSSSGHSEIKLRQWISPGLPPEPWPLLLPCSHFDLLAGRDRDLSQLLIHFSRPQSILGLHAVSGTGKSSLLEAGLVPYLRQQGKAVAFDRRPKEPGLAARLVGDLLSGPEGPLDSASLPDDQDPQTFLHLILLAGRRAGSSPILVLDQVEEVLWGDRRARAVLGTLLAVTIQRRPEVEGSPCRWLLAYRREFHGELLRWLADALREARALGFPGAGGLPHDLSSHERFHDWPLPVVGAVESSGQDPKEAFLDILTRPLELKDEQGNSLYPWRFEGNGAERLATAFAEARRNEPNAPLVPQLQVVLAHLMAHAKRPTGRDEISTLVVPSHPSELIDQALERHLARALDQAFPAEDRIGRTRALLALYELTDAGRRGSARDGGELARTLGQRGDEVLETLQASGARLVVAFDRGGETVYSLAHDRLAEVITEAVEGQGGLSLDPELLTLRRFVALSTELFHSGEVAASTRVGSTKRAGIEAFSDCLLVDVRRRDWWEACKARHRRDRKRRMVAGTALLLILAVAAWVIASFFAKEAAREALLEMVAQGDPEGAFVAFGEALEDDEIETSVLWAHLLERPKPLDILESGMGGLPEPQRSDVVLTVAELAMPLVQQGGPEDPIALASLLWALDFGPTRNPETADRAFELRATALAELWERHPPPKDGAVSSWATIPAGRFRMGTDSEQAKEEERPAHEVEISYGFRMLDHEVTAADYLRFDPSHGHSDEIPARANWYHAYLYSAWLGGPGSVGRLPTEAEWDHAARAGCPFHFCSADGVEAEVEKVAWMIRNSTDPITRNQRPQPVRKLEPNLWGLHDMYGNVWEWVSDWHSPYSVEPQIDPRGPTSGLTRACRGGSFRGRDSLGPAARISFRPTTVLDFMGFRPVLVFAEGRSSAAPSTASEQEQTGGEG